MGTSDQRVLNGVNLQATTIITPSWMMVSWWRNRLFNHRNLESPVRMRWNLKPKKIGLLTWSVGFRTWPCDIHNREPICLTFFTNNINIYNSNNNNYYNKEIYRSQFQVISRWWFGVLKGSGPSRHESRLNMKWQSTVHAVQNVAPRSSLALRTWKSYEK